MATRLIRRGKLTACAGKKSSLPLRIRESRALVGIGHFSYSLSLIHAAVLALMALALSHLFFRLFERPFLSVMSPWAQVARGR